jgi:hypothetical protein
MAPKLKPFQVSSGRRQLQNSFIILLCLIGTAAISFGQTDNTVVTVPSTVAAASTIKLPVYILKKADYLNSVLYTTARNKSQLTLCLTNPVNTSVLEAYIVNKSSIHILGVKAFQPQIVDIPQSDTSVTVTSPYITSNVIFNAKDLKDSLSGKSYDEIDFIPTNVTLSNGKNYLTFFIVAVQKAKARGGFLETTAPVGTANPSPPAKPQ